MMLGFNFLEGKVVECPTCGQDFDVRTWGWNDDTDQAWGLAIAAPDLLEVLLKADGCLQEYIEFLDSERFSNDDEVELLVLVQAAIAKAEVG